MTTLLDLARAVQEACAQECMLCVSVETNPDYQKVRDRTRRILAAAIRDRDISRILAQFGDVVVVPRIYVLGLKQIAFKDTEFAKENYKKLLSCLEASNEQT